MTNESERTQQLRARDRRFLWHPFTPMKLWQEEDFPIIERGEGNYLIDTEGNRYLDGISSLWCNMHGHRRREIDEAIVAQLGKIAHSTFLGLSHPLAIELAEELISIAPKGLARVFYSDNGSTAMEVALKMAFHYWAQNGKPEKAKFITLSEAYHGDTIGAVSLGGMALFHERYRSLLFETIHAPTTYAYRCPKADTLEDCGRHCLAEIEEILKARAGEIAGLVIEPRVQAAAGMIVQPQGFVASVRKLCDTYNVLMIVDEVATGFGRTGRMFACQRENVAPDIMAVGKGLTGGYLPLAATLTTERVYEGFLGEFKDRRTFFHGHTYTANPLGCAAALENLRIFRRENTVKRVSDLAHRMGNELQILYNLAWVGDIRSLGLMIGLELVKNADTREPFPYEGRMGHRVILEARRRGVILRPLGDVVVLMPPLSIQEEELAELCRVTYESIEAVCSTVTS